MGSGRSRPFLDTTISDHHHDDVDSYYHYLIGGDKLNLFLSFKNDKNSGLELADGAQSKRGGGREFRIRNQL